MRCFIVFLRTWNQQLRESIYHGKHTARSKAMEHREETTTLISAEKVSGTDVYNTAGDSLGEVHDVMIDKVSGRVTYAVMSFGGFLGIGQKYHPLPWSSLVYDTDKG